MRVKKKYAMAWAVFAVGAYIGVTTAASLGEWTAFGVMLLAAFAASDVADKRLNGGSY